MIQSYKFGHIVIKDQEYQNDVKISEGKVISPWWRKSGHKVEIEDIKDLLASNPEILIFGKGNPGLMQATKELRTYLINEGIQLIELPTSEAIENFNRLFQEGRKVCAGFHLTC